MLVVDHRCSECSKRSLSFLKRMYSFTFFSILFWASVSECEFFNLSYTICMKIYDNIQHFMDIYDEIFILRHSVFPNLSMHWHLEFRLIIELFSMCHYYITRYFARTFTFFIIFEKNAFFNVLYSYFSRLLHLYWG